jgi:predicted Zn-dependent protease
MKYLLVLLLAGCARQQMPELNMDAYQADCRMANRQMRELESALKQYEQSEASNYDYYQQLKNNIWSLRSHCPAFKK